MSWKALREAMNRTNAGSNCSTNQRYPVRWIYSNLEKRISLTDIAKELQACLSISTLPPLHPLIYREI